ncbi:class I SAM-dependent methyltransferase [Calothrix sp. UHCC 0171]|uniref:class I SAM-dependent methyltransferase n=1 Tax=Calothrix sp. UHCC 0171 TaxID=3110245 RepID=UPI002B20CFA6|nr:methyltransferase domain-containing protein [Calothrix sp. UHCC 0171]MEA5570431.1 methyltransferase domain-containing protein [Calothrix sp. UHCC 0171]
MDRILEPEVMDTWEESIAYDAMDFTEVNTAFANDAIALAPTQPILVLDAGTGPGRIPTIMAQLRPQWQFIGVDLAASMLQIAQQQVEQVNLQEQIRFELVDVKNLPYEDGQFDLVVSNSLVHHLAEPLPFFQEIKRILKPHGGILIRDLFRPANIETLNALVDSITKDCDARQKKLFGDSLQAALTIDEVRNLIEQAGLKNIDVYQNSDRHWTAKRSWGAST